MARYAAFLRGINLGGRRVKGPQFIAMFEDLGLTEVATFRASGNVVFSAGGEPAAKLGRRIEAGLESGLGYDVAVFLRTADDVRAIAAQEPFPRDRVEASDGKLQVALLPRTPSAAARERALAQATEADLLALDGRELYWLPSGRMSDSQLDLPALERLVGPWTMRTMGTIEQIAAKYLAER